jgi:Putative esterase
VLAALAAALLVLATATARASEVELAPAGDGSLGAWLSAGPIPSALGQDLDLTPIDPRAGAKPPSKGWMPSWRLLSVADGAIDLAKQLGTGDRAGPYALVGGVLELQQDLDGWLMLSADGGVRIDVDGKPLWHRDLLRLRGESWDVLPLRLAKGRHRLVMLLHHPERYFAFEVRVLERKTLLPPSGLSLLLPGTSDADAKRLARDMLTETIGAGLEASGYRPRVTLAYRRGVPRGIALDAHVEVTAPNGSKPIVRVSAGSITLTAHGTYPLEVRLPRLASSALRASLELLHVTARVGKVSVNAPLIVSSAAPAALGRADAALGALGKDTKLLDASVVRATLEERVHQLETAGTGDHPAEVIVSRALRSLDELTRALAQARDPLAEHGLLDLARRSDLDGHPQPFVLHVPASYAPGGAHRYPLVVVLHGYNGYPRRVMRAFLDSDSSTPAVDGFVLAPHAFGNAFYRGPGEHETMRAIDWVMKTYPIDPDRVSITGVSMGGTGTAELAFFHAGRFAAAAPLCGYQSYFVRHDTSGRPIRPWERARMQHWSPASWAENGRNLPLYLAQGTRDFPLADGKVLVKRYHELGYSIRDDWPDIGHNVWTITYAGARMWPWLTQWKRDPEPAHVTLKTDQLRYARQAWVRIVELARPEHMGSVDAEVQAPDRIAVHTGAVDAFALTRPVPRVKADAPLNVDVDGQSFEFRPKQPLALHRDASGWHIGPPAIAPGQKRAGVEGPIRDAFQGKLAFVYGTLDPATTRANREVARAFARVGWGVDIHYPVLADRDVPPSFEHDHSLLLVGSARDNLLVRAIDSKLPLHVSGDALMLGAHRYAGDDVGAIFIYPNPHEPDRYVVVVEGVTARGVWRALSLPQLLPDFLVYDSGLAGAATEQVLGSDAQVLAGGFFDRTWRVPARVADPDARALRGTP